jgi:hypothetical protein
MQQFGNISHQECPTKGKLFLMHFCFCAVWIHPKWDIATIEIRHLSLSMLCKIVWWQLWNFNVWGSWKSKLDSIRFQIQKKFPQLKHFFITIQYYERWNKMVMIVEFYDLIWENLGVWRKKNSFILLTVAQNSFFLSLPFKVF